MEPVPAASLTGRDRLSDLPDCLLHSVLSSLRSRQVVQSCLLSRRWRHLWRSVPCLDVDQREFLLDEPVPEAPCRNRYASDADWHAYNKANTERFDIDLKRQRSFEDFADTVLPLNGTWPLDAYRLHVADEDLRNASYRWIRRGLARLPMELRIAYDFRSHEDDLFSFELASGGARALSVTSRLRRLHLSELTLSEKLAEEIRSECPVLEELKLLNCDYDYKFDGRIVSSSLKRLEVDGCYRSYRSFTSPDENAWLPTEIPLLPDYQPPPVNKILLPDIEDELPSLDVASIREPNNYYAGEYGVLKSMRNARVLELRRFTSYGLLAEEPKEFCKFHNLRTMILINCYIGDRCKVLRYVLENVPNLERLVLRDCETYGHCREESASSKCGTSLDGCKNLKSIRVKYDHGVPLELVDVLTQIAKDVVKTPLGRIHYVGWKDWMRRVVGWEKKFLRRQRYAATAYASAAAKSDNSLSDEEHQSPMWKHHVRKKHDGDGDYIVKASRRTAQRKARR